jgi:hypothetical protein
VAPEVSSKEGAGFRRPLSRGARLNFGERGRANGSREYSLPPPPSADKFRIMKANGNEFKCDNNITKIINF